MEKLQRLGFSGIGREQIVTSGDVMAHFLKQKFSYPHIYLAGTPSLAKQLREQGNRPASSGYPSADAVVIGFDTTFSFEKATAACRLIAAGVPFSPPTSTGSVPWRPGPFSPDCGSICAMLSMPPVSRPNSWANPLQKLWIIFWPRREPPPERTAMVGIGCIPTSPRQKTETLWALPSFRGRSARRISTPPHSAGFHPFLVSKSYMKPFDKRRNI